MKGARLLWLLLWAAGAVAVILFLMQADHALKHRATVNYDSISYINGTLLLHLAAGVYFSLFTLKKGRPRIDVGFLAVTFLPLLLVLIVQRFYYFFSIHLDMRLLALMCGLTLGYGLLKQRPQA